MSEYADLPAELVEVIEAGRAAAERRLLGESFGEDEEDYFSDDLELELNLELDSDDSTTDSDPSDTESNNCRSSSHSTITWADIRGLPEFCSLFFDTEVPFGSQIMRRTVSHSKTKGYRTNFTWNKAPLAVRREPTSLFALLDVLLACRPLETLYTPRGFSNWKETSPFVFDCNAAWHDGSLVSISRK